MSSRAWCFTINNWTEDDCADCILMSDDARYIICGFETGRKGTPHIQGYVYFTSEHSLNRMKKYLPRARLAVAKGSSKQNYKYCSKDGCYWEAGDMPSQGAVSRGILEDVMNNPYENFHLYNQYRRAYNELKRSEKKTHDRRLLLVDEKDIPKFALTHDSVVIIDDSTLDLYTDEQAVFFRNETVKYNNIIDWLNAIPPKVKRGYEIIKFDPEVVYLVYSTPTAYARLVKLYNNNLSIE